MSQLLSVHLKPFAARSFIIRFRGGACLCLAVIFLLGCAPAVHSQGTSCSTRDDRCASGTFCESVGEPCGEVGRCVVVPEMCTMIYSPVCGCDGKDYGNECVAKGERVSVRHPGRCPSVSPKDEARKQCASNDDCPSSFYCTFPKADCGKKEPGKCVERPEGCAAVYTPVCGCDGRTHSNRCTAANVGVSLKSIGECQGAK